MGTKPQAQSPKILTPKSMPVEAVPPLGPTADALKIAAGIWVAVKELKFRDYPPIMENQMEKKMENEMETGGI